MDKMIIKGKGEFARSLSCARNNRNIQRIAQFRFGETYDMVQPASEIRAQLIIYGQVKSDFAHSYSLEVSDNESSGHE